jgi:hypothetical protein
MTSTLKLITEERRHQKMEPSPMLIGWQNQYCENSYTTKYDLYVQCNTHQNSRDILQRYKRQS